MELLEKIINVDVFVGSHSEAMNKGRYSAPVYIVE